MELLQTEPDLDALKRYLTRAHGMNVRGIRVRADQECNRRLRRNARSFAFTIKGSKIIHCADILEVIGHDMRVGILLHEILHIALPAFGDDAEIKVDEFATSELKETGYGYANRTYWAYTGGPGGFREYTAKAIECVSERFLRKLEKFRR